MNMATTGGARQPDLVRVRVRVRVRVWARARVRVRVRVRVSKVPPSGGYHYGW